MSSRARALLAAAVAALLVVWLGPSARRSPSAPSEPAAESPRPVEKIRIAHVELPRVPEPERQRPSPPPPPARAPQKLPKSEPESTPPTPSAQSPERVRPDAAALERGRARLSSGSFPRLRASYARIGFERYRDAVHRLGGGFFLYDADTRRPVARIDPSSGVVLDGLDLAGLSVWPRDVTRHLQTALADGRERVGPSVNRVVLLPPSSVDAALLGGLDAHLRKIGVAPTRVVRVDVAYELHAGRLACEVLTVAMSDGQERDLHLKIDLSGGAA